MSVLCLIEELAEQMKNVDNNIAAINNDVEKQKQIMDTKFITIKEFNQLEELEKFLKKYDDLDDEEFYAIIHGNVFYFRFFRQVYEHVPNFQDILTEEGAAAVAKIYDINMQSQRPEI